MPTNKKKEQDGTTFSTQIDSITGVVSTGPGDINITMRDFFVGSNTKSTKEEFLEALRQFKKEIDNARQQGLPEDTADDVIVEVEAAEREIAKDTPKSNRIISRLENAKAILLGSASVATAATSVAAATGKLIPYLEQAIQAVSKIF
jgi:hypothetical protein